MTNFKHLLIGTLGIVMAGLVAVTPASADVLRLGQPSVEAGHGSDVHLIDHKGSWKKKKYFKSKNYFKKKKHFRGDHYSDRGHYRDHDYHYKKRKKIKRAYRRGYDDGYYEGRQDRHYYGYKDYRRSKFHRHKHRRHHHRRGYSYGSGYIEFPGIYFRF